MKRTSFTIGKSTRQRRVHPLYVEDVGQLRALARFGYSCCLCVDATGVRPISSEGIFGGYHASCIFGSYQLPLATMRMPVIVMV